MNASTSTVWYLSLTYRSYDVFTHVYSCFSFWTLQEGAQLLFLVDERQAQAMQNIVEKEMSGVIALPRYIRLDVNSRIGPSWAEAQSRTDL